MAARSTSKTPKTLPTSASVSAFLAKAAAGSRLDDAKALVAMMESATGRKAIMWGDGIVGFDTYMIRYADGRELPWPVVAFAPRKPAFVLYIGRKHADMVKRLGKCKMAGGCLHIKSLADIDVTILKRLIAATVTARR